MVSAPANAKQASAKALTRLSEEHTRVPLRLMGGSLTVAVELPPSMTETAWKQMMAMLNALKPGYVSESDDEPSDEPATSDS